MTSTIHSVPARRLTPEQISAWSRIYSESGLLESPYLRPEFTQAVAAVRDDIEVAVVEDQGRPLGFLPFRRLPWNGGRPAGGWLANFQAVIAADAVDPLELMRACRLRSWQFDHLLSPPPSMMPYVWRKWQSPYADLSAGFDAYIKKLGGPGKISEFGRLQRKLTRDIGPVRFEPQVADPKILATMIEWKAAQYKRTGERNIFAAPWICDLLETLLEVRGMALSPMLSVLYAGDRVAAIAYTLRSGSSLHGWFTAFDRELSSYSPGTQLLIELFRSAEALGISRIDLGKGPEAYKRRFMTDAVDVYEGTIDANAVVSRVRRCWWRTKDCVRKSPLASATRFPSRMARVMQGWVEMR